MQPDTLRAIALAANVSAADHVLEIGAGPGNLTRELARLVSSHGRVRAIELDRDWTSMLESLHENHAQVDVTWGDALTVDFDTLLGGTPGPWKCVANIPYYITSQLVQKLVEYRRYFSVMALLMQQEVAERLNAERGREVGMLSYFVHYHCTTELALTVPASAFRPPPKVDSALLILRPRAVPAVDIPFDGIRPIIQAAFASRRKMLRKTLCALPGMRDRGDVLPWLERASIAADARPEELTLLDFARLASARTACGPPTPDP